MISSQLNILAVRKVALGNLKNLIKSLYELFLELSYVCMALHLVSMCFRIKVYKTEQYDP
jgi:hypothetical protein